MRLNLERIPYGLRFVHLDKDGGQNMQDWYRVINPHEHVPALLVEEAGRRDILVQSMAILECLEERFPEKPLLPQDPILRARIRSVPNIVNADMHPIMNAFGREPTLADIFIVPQVFNARRFDMNLDALPKILAIERLAAAHEASVKTEPRNQPDFG